MFTEEEKDFSLDHIIMMAISEIEENFEEIPKIFIDDRFQNYTIRLNDLQVGDMIYAITTKLEPYLSKGYTRLNVVALADEENPNVVDLGITVLGKSKKKEQKRPRRSRFRTRRLYAS